ncbi:MAG: glycosyltransferase family 39 protein [Anaerolineae bacterium]|jgi:4-amino-4-deoxy-L-arabinose transferase-like glycosyltransferase
MPPTELSAGTNLRRRWIKFAALLGIVLLAAFFRLSQIDTIPPGNRYDPAYYGVDALRILDGEWPVFLSTNFGREVLFSYLVALYIALFGPASNAMYVVSAWVGIATVPAVFLLAEELFSTEEALLRRYGGLVAALTLAISYWHLNWSRFGVRAVLVPLVAALTFYFLWRALRTGSTGSFVAAGFFLGLGAYTYQAARLYPVLVVLAFAYVLIARRKITRRDWMHLALVVLVSLIVFAPLAAYFVSHPGSFAQRIGQTSVLAGAQGIRASLSALWNGIVDTVLSFSFQGDLEPTTNLPGRPTLNAFLSILFGAGLVVSLVRIKKPLYLFLLSWLGVMLIPAVLSQFGPIAKRAIGTLPAVMLLVAVGALGPWAAVQRWATRAGTRWVKGLSLAVRALIVAGFVLSAAWTYRDYFLVWAADPDLFTHFEVGPTTMGQYAGTLSRDAVVYISPVAPDHPSIVYNALDHPGLKGYDGRACFVAPQEAVHETQYLIVPADDPSSLDLLHTVFPQGEIVAEGPRHYGQPYFYAYGIPPGERAQVSPSNVAEATWEDKIRLLGYDANASTYQAGDVVQVTPYFQALGPMAEDYTVFFQLLGPDNPATGGPVWGQDDSEPCRRAYPTSVWAPGEIILDVFATTIPQDAPPGEYELRIGFYRLETLVRLPAVDAVGQPVPGDAVLLRRFRLEGPSP